MGGGGGGVHNFLRALYRVRAVVSRGEKHGLML